MGGYWGEEMEFAVKLQTLIEFEMFGIPESERKWGRVGG